MALPATRNMSIVPAHGSDAEWWAIAQQQASMLVKTGFLPTSIKTPEQALAIMMKGRELGVPPMYALSNITVIQGKPTCNAELMLALVRRDHGPNAVRVAESSNDACTVEWRTWGSVSSYTFTIEDAKRAGLLQNQTWTKYPAAMLRARCISAVCRMAFPESIAGMYTAEELGGPVFVDESEIDTVPTARVVTVDPASGEIMGAVTVETNAHNDSEPAMTDQQKKKIWAMAQDLGMDLEALHQFAGVASLSTLTKGQASELITRLDAAIGAAMEDAEPAPMLETGDPDRYTR